MDAQLVKELFDYDPETGILRWRISISCHKRGSVAGSRKSNGRYLEVRYKGGWFLAHRLIFLWMTGRWPEPETDHLDLDGVNNRWCNLRESTKSQNAANRAAFRTNRTGLKGVVNVVRDGKAKFEARIRIDGKQKHLGRFETAQEAHAAYVTAAKRFFGDFAHS
jgi:hypothetical protein